MRTETEKEILFLLLGMVMTLFLERLLGHHVSGSDLWPQLLVVENLKETRVAMYVFPASQTAGLCQGIGCSRHNLENFRAGLQPADHLSTSGN